MYFQTKLAWPPATCDVTSRSHSSWPSLNLSQNLRKGWTNSYWRRQVLMFFPLGKNSEKHHQQHHQLFLNWSIFKWRKSWILFNGIYYTLPSNLQFRPKTLISPCWWCCSGIFVAWLLQPLAGMPFLCLQICLVRLTSLASNSTEIQYAVIPPERRLTMRHFTTTGRISAVRW